MITDFEKITQPLDKEEKRIAKFIGQYIYKHGRKGKETSNTNLRVVAQANGFPWLKSIRVRAMIHWLRVQKAYKWILANGKGYYYSRDSEDVMRYLASLDNRINAIRRVRNSIELPKRKKRKL
jgi:hypothetical protein